jgi:hypothetical protein
MTGLATKPYTPEKNMSIKVIFKTSVLLLKEKEKADLLA